jgi:two-component system, OmpR family, heavy metal sensor histidine kinase CusS
MGKRSITFRLALYFGVASTTVLLAIGYLVGVFVERHFLELDHTELHGKLELVSHLLGKVRSPADIEALPERMSDAFTGHESLSVSITGPGGKTLFAMGSAAFPARLIKDAPDVERSGKFEMVSWSHDGQVYHGFATNVETKAQELPRAVVAVALNFAAHRDFMAEFYEILWLAIAAGILSTGLLGWIAARRGLAPVREMTRVAQNITASRLHDRLPMASLPTELVALAGAFNGMLSRLEDSFRRLSEFSSDLAHELRTPIASLMTQTHVALSRARSAEEYREVLYSSSEEYERLARMIADMLFLAKADNGLIVPRSESVDLVDEVRELFEFYDALAEDQGVRLELAGNGAVDGERLMIRRAISNLLSNAINHTPRGGCVNVRIGHGDGEGVRLAVENPGDGIASEHLPRIFDRFYRVDPSRQRSTDGAGLGLAITKSIAAAHGGTVQAFSVEGMTRFEIQFPAPGSG